MENKEKIEKLREILKGVWAKELPHEGKIFDPYRPTTDQVFERWYNMAVSKSEGDDNKLIETMIERARLAGVENEILSMFN